MMPLVALEGIDGAGKTEQTKRLLSRLKKSKIKTAVFSFPRYKHPSSFFVRQYLAGEYGSWDSVDAKTASLFFAIDRFDASKEISALRKKTTFIIANRYSASNMAHQSARIASTAKRTQFIRWVEELEYKRLNIPKPDVTIFLDTDPKTAAKLIHHRLKDTHEKDKTHQERTYATYKLLAKQNPRSWITIASTEKGGLRTPKAIADDVWKIIQKRFRL